MELVGVFPSVEHEPLVAAVVAAQHHLRSEQLLAHVVDVQCCCWAVRLGSAVF